MGMKHPKVHTQLLLHPMKLLPLMYQPTDHLTVQDPRAKLNPLLLLGLYHLLDHLIQQPLHLNHLILLQQTLCTLHQKLIQHQKPPIKVPKTLIHLPQNPIPHQKHLIHNQRAAIQLPNSLMVPLLIHKTPILQVNTPTLMLSQRMIYRLGRKDQGKH